MGNILTKQFYRQRKDFEDSCAGRDGSLVNKVTGVFNWIF